jgi:RNA polymerase-binding protein DksA
MTITLTPGQRAQLEAELTARRQELERQLAEHLHGQTRAERAHDVLTQDGDDAPQRLPERDIAAALTNQEQVELERVTTALQRLERGDYGRCVDCGIDIPFDRLKAEPWALRCIDCETARERTAARRAP